MIRLFASDMNGTLLNNEGYISCDMICHSGACIYDIYGNVLCLLFMKPLSIG